MSARFLVTGGTGFLGRHVVERLLPFGNVTVLSRHPPDWFPPNVRFLKGDLSIWDAQIDVSKIRGQFDACIHMGGLYDLRATILQAYQHNVTGTHTALALCQNAIIPHFIHISTVAVTAFQKGAVIAPDQLDTKTGFPDAYAHSKAIAETTIRNWSSFQFKTRLILRLGILVGDTQKGKILRIDGPYHAAVFLKKVIDKIQFWKGPIPLPGRSHSQLPLVPVDRAADAIAKLAAKAVNEHIPGLSALHLAPAIGLAPLDLYRSAFRHLDIDPSQIRLIERAPTWILKMMGEKLFQFPKEELEYFLNFPHLDTSATRALLGDRWCPSFSEYESVFWKGFDDYLSNS